MSEGNLLPSAAHRGPSGRVETMTSTPVPRASGSAVAAAVPAGTASIVTDPAEEEDFGAPPTVPSSTSPILFLSVFLLLSGVFVLLIAMSEFDRDRTKRVLESLGRQFATAPAAGGETPFSAAGRLSLPLVVGDTPRALRFGPPLTAEARRAGIVGRVELPSTRLFDERGEVPRERWLLFGRMAAATRDPRAWGLEIAAPWTDRADAAELAFRLEKLLALLDRLGADPAAVTYGLGRTDGEIWSFTFRERLAGADG